MMTVMHCDPSEAQNHASPKRTKRPVACHYCRLKKVRCNGEQPTCGNCIDRGEKCVYPALKRRSRRESHENNKVIMDRIARIEAILEEAYTPSQVRNGEDESQHIPAAEVVQKTSPYVPDQEQQLQQRIPLSPPQTDYSYQLLQCTPPQDAHTTALSHRRSSHTPAAGHVLDSSNPSPTSPNLGTHKEMSHKSPQVSQLVDSRTAYSESYRDVNDVDIDPLRPGQKTPMDQIIDNIHSPESPDWEYHGPASFLSLCSKAGIDWVAERTGSTEFAQIAMNFRRSTTKLLKLDHRLSTERAPEPDRETAFRYATEYFEKAPDAPFDIIVRSRFEARLRTHFDSAGTSEQDEDPAWYALRNVVYAQGCRLELGNKGYSFNYTKPQIAGWQYFENSLSKHSELCFSRTGLMAIQALLCMAFYAEALSCPKLEYMLASTALRLAQSKGLHRQPGSTWGISPQDTDQRNWIFWVLYIFEKHISQRSGRPSAIDDDDISCQIPTRIPSNNTNKLEFCTLAAKHAKISSLIAKRCSSVAAYRQTPDEVVRTVCELDRQLRDWRDLIPLSMRPGTVLDPTNLPRGLQTTHAIYLHYSYFGSLIGIHSIFTYPWSEMLGRDRSPSLRDQINASSEIVAEASRGIILMTRYINDIYAWTPTWLGFYYPILGLINLFVHVLKYPTAPTAPSDIALLDVVSGHLARIEFASSGQLSFSVARDLSGLARVATKRAKQNMLNENERQDSIIVADPAYEQMPTDDFDYGLDSINMNDFDMEDWSTLLPCDDFLQTT